MAHCIRCGRTISGFTLGKKICVWCKQHEAAQRGEGSDYQPVMVSPWARREALPMVVTQAIFGINVAVFLGMLLSRASPLSPSTDALLNWGANYGTYTLTGQSWRLLTSCFVHIGIIHLAFNLWCLWSLGEVAERLYGHVTFAWIYLLCGIAGSLGSVFWHATPTVSAGASGAIFGIAGAVIASLKLGEFRSPHLAQGTMQSLIMFVAYNVIFGAISGRTDNACHFGGLLAGVVLGALIAKVAPTPAMGKRLAIAALVTALLAGGLFEMQKRRAYPYLLSRAAEAVGDGRLDDAIPLYQRALRLRQDKALALHYQLAHVYWMKKDFAGAERELQQVLAADAKDEQVLADLAGVQLDEHHTTQARQSYEQLLQLDPESADAHMGLGDVAVAEGNCALALKSYARAATLNPHLGGVHAKTGACLSQLKQTDAAIAEYRREIDTSGDSSAMEEALAEAYKAKGMSNEASEAAQKASDLRSTE